MQKHFLGWDGYFLHLTVEFLVESHVTDRKLDLRNLILTLPGNRAISRLQELLVDRVAEEADKKSAVRKFESDWYPPVFCTLGTLPELFYKKDKPFADTFTQELAWGEAVDQSAKEQPDTLRKIIPHLPETNDARLALGKMFADIHTELASNGLDFNDVAEHCRKHGITEEANRWKTLAEIQTRYLKILDDAEIWDMQTARLFFLRPPAEKKKDIETQKKEKIQQFRQQKTQIYLVGLTDMNQVQKDMLHTFDEFITALVFAPKDRQNMFDAFGCIIPEKWLYSEERTETQIGIEDKKQIKFVSGYEQQAEEVLRRIASFGSKYSTQDIAVAVPDKDILPVLQQQLEKHGIKCRYAEGKPVKQTPVFRFLNSLLKFTDTFLFSDFAELVRHPDVQRYIEGDLNDKENISIDILTVLDKYHTEHLPLELPEDGKFICQPDRDGEHRPENCYACRLALIWSAFIGLTGEINELKQKRTLIDWVKTISGLLEKLYGKLPQKIDSTSDAKRIENRIRILIQNMFRSFEQIPSSLVPNTDAAEALRYLLRQLQRESIPPREEKGAIELLGWLETVMLDVPAVIVTGVNDGRLPAFVTSDVFLPDSMRQKLNLDDNRRRYARDAYNLQAVLNSKRNTEDVLLISGRQSKDGVMKPSCLFFAADDATAVKRVSLFFVEEKEPLTPQSDETQPEQRNPKYLFSVPAFDKAITIETISVTHFKSYLASPCRYFLEKQLKLKALNDDKEEIDNMKFGNIVHHVLEVFGKSEIKDSDNAGVIFSFLTEELGRQIQKIYGGNPRAVILIQKEKAVQRLKAFAEKQAEHRLEGWKILTTEFDCKKETGVVLKLSNGGTISLIGRIDRIDYKEDAGYLVLDYKTGSKKPEEEHRKKDGTWIDLQLPLYNYILRHLPDCEKARFPNLNSKSKISTGYFLLPSESDKTKIHTVNWEENGLYDE
ncbi:MAG: PD-(D/E)XK nuclease family protein, partial [Planctomycetaceae bacterium]|nr:PD-(D/E)XK nuclease family protein [Planctomycetaceae bacterium]